MAGGILAGAVALELIADLDPCRLCLWQRVPYGLYAPVMLAAGALVAYRRLLLLVGAGLMVISFGLAGYHMGVEFGWWASNCGGTSLAGLTASQAADALLATTPGGCDIVTWRLWGLSLTQYNGIMSLALLGGTIGVLRWQDVR